MYYWNCERCDRKTPIVENTILCGLDYRKFDTALELWVRSCNPNTANHIVRSWMCGTFFNIFRKATSHYMTTKVLPYLKLPGIVEIDETMISRKTWNYACGTCPKIRWVFGLYCRKT